MQLVVDFKNLAIRDYQHLKLNIVIAIVKNHLVDFDIFVCNLSSIELISLERGGVLLIVFA